MLEDYHADPANNKLGHRSESKKIIKSLRNMWNDEFFFGV